MEARVPARMTAAEGRKFGVTVGLAFAVIGLLMIWRHHTGRATVALSLGGVLVLAGLVVPTMLGPVERAWMGLAHLISKVTTPIFMGVVYFVLITPAGLIRRMMGASPITQRPKTDTRWTPHADASAEQMERQF